MANYYDIKVNSLFNKCDFRYARTVHGVDSIGNGVKDHSIFYGFDIGKHTNEDQFMCLDHACSVYKKKINKFMEF